MLEGGNEVSLVGVETDSPYGRRMVWSFVDLLSDASIIVGRGAVSIEYRRISEHRRSMFRGICFFKSTEG